MQTTVETSDIKNLSIINKRVTIIEWGTFLNVTIIEWGYYKF